MRMADGFRSALKFQYRRCKMKKLFNLFITFAVIATLVGIGFAIDADTYAVVPDIKNHLGGTTLKVTFPAIDDSTGSQHTYPIFIGSINDSDGYLKVITNATADINPVFHFSNDLTTWKSVTASNIDAVSNTAEYDTLGGVVLVDFHKFSWMVIESDAQAGTNTTDILYLEANFQADVKQPTASGQALKHCFYTETNITDP